MASYRPFPPPPPPTQTPLPPPPPPQQSRPNQYSFPQNYPQIPPQQNFPQHYPPPPPHQQYPYQPPPPPPPPESSYPPPPPPPPAPSQQQQPLYYSTSHYSQYAPQPIQPPPPPPSSPPPSSSVPPPPPPSSPPPPPPPKERGVEREKGGFKERRDPGHSKQQQKPPQAAVKKVNGASGRVETEEERRLRKKREFEKQRQEERNRQHHQQLKESQNPVLQKNQMLASQKAHGSIVGSRMADKRVTPILAERADNRLKKPTTFLCKLKFRNELPDPSAQPKLMTLKKEKDRFTKYTITSLEKMHKPQLFVEPDLGVPLDLLDLSVYNPPSIKPSLDLEDEELLRDDELATPVKRDGIRRKERPTDKGVSWLVKTQYISSLSMESTKQSLTEKQAKELREMKGGRGLLENLNDRERQIKEIEASFEANKLHPVHATNKNLHATEIFPLLPDFDRYEDKFVTLAFDSAPTADAENYSKLDPSVRDACESRAVMKACVATGSDPANPEKFLAYMAPYPNELSKDIYDENEDIAYNWIREYHWDVRGDDVNDPTTFLVSFDETDARYVPLPTKINLRKRRARDGRSGDEVEHFPVPSKVTVRRRATAATIEVRDPGVNMNSRANFSSSRMGRLNDDDDDLGRHHSNDHSSGAEDYLSE